MEDTNKDLKILEEIKDMFIHLKNYGYINDIKKEIDTDKAIQAIESTINRYKELEEKNQLLLNSKIGVDLSFDDYIPVSLVEEKIEELKEKRDDYLYKLQVYGDFRINEPNYSDLILQINFKIQVLQELLEKRK